MTSSHFGHPDIDAALDILGVCLLSDRMERDEELVELANSAQVLARHCAPEIVISRRDVLDWFAAEHDRLADVVGDEPATRALFARITDPETRRVALAAIFAVCVCDYQLADEESAFIRLALDEWAPVRLTTDDLSVIE